MQFARAKMLKPVSGSLALHLTIVVGAIGWQASNQKMFGQRSEIAFIDLGNGANAAGSQRETLAKAERKSVTAPKNETVKAAPQAAAKYSFNDQVSTQAAAPQEADSAGSGSGRGAGSGAKSAGENSPYLSELRALIEAKKNYPQRARRLHQVGEVLVKFLIRPDGSFGEIALLSETPFALLNEAAHGLIAGIGKFHPLPEALSSGGEGFRVTIPISYRLN